MNMNFKLYDHVYFAVTYIEGFIKATVYSGRVSAIRTTSAGNTIVTVTPDKRSRKYNFDAKTGLGTAGNSEARIFATEAECRSFVREMNHESADKIRGFYADLKRKNDERIEELLARFRELSKRAAETSNASYAIELASEIGSLADKIEGAVNGASCYEEGVAEACVA